ncbi:TPA: hypothetical protein NU929_003373 [Vibrio cholerae]|nr:hypothetical protein [Vibrio cholerae]
MRHLTEHQEDPRIASDNTLIASTLTTLDDLLKSPGVIKGRHIHFQLPLPYMASDSFLSLLKKAGAHSFYSKNTGYVIFDDE